MSLDSTATAVARALSYARNRTRVTPGMCDHYVAVYNGLSSSGYATAYKHFLATPARYRHGLSQAPPAGASVFWGGGSSGAGHAAFSVGGGSFEKNDNVA